MSENYGSEACETYSPEEVNQYVVDLRLKMLKMKFDSRKKEPDTEEV